MKRRMRKLLVLVGFALLALFAVVPVSSATRTPTEGYSCQTVGGGSICRSFRIETTGPTDTGIVCGSGTDAFDIFDQGVNNETRTLWLDENGQATNRSDHDVYSSSQWSNPLTGKVVPYTQHSEENDDFPIPGDTSVATQKFTGENIYHLPGGQFVLKAVGMQVYNWDFSELLSSHGPNAFIDAFYERDPHAFDQICAALGAS